MSTSAAIAAVTRTLASLLETALQAEDASYKVSTLPLDRSNAETQQANRLNLYLYSVGTNGAWRNHDLPDRTRPGENGRPPLALNLTYLITVYGEAGPDTKDQRILGLAMQFLNDNSLLMAADIRLAFPGTGLEDQIERVRITPRPLNLEEISRMWGAFQTQYRTSTAYDVSVVLIDSAPVGPGALPVLRRGERDQGVIAEAGLPPFLTRSLPPELLRRGVQVVYQPAARVGEVLTVEGDRMPLEGAILQVRSPAWEPRWVGLQALPVAGRPNILQAVLADPPPEPDPPAGTPPPLEWSPGVYTAALLIRRPDLPDLVSNAVPFALAPTVTYNPLTAAPEIWRCRQPATPRRGPASTPFCCSPAASRSRQPA